MKKNQADPSNCKPARVSTKHPKNNNPACKNNNEVYYEKAFNHAGYDEEEERTYFEERYPNPRQREFKGPVAERSRKKN